MEKYALLHQSLSISKAPEIWVYGSQANQSLHFTALLHGCVFTTPSEAKIC